MSEYFWCHLKNGNKYTAGYIEKHGAKVGNRVEMVDLDGEFWDVTRVNPQGVTKEYVRKHERQHKAFQESLLGGGIDERKTRSGNL